jgi:creatinine amidohydrolase
VVLVNGHGGNASTLEAARALLVSEGRNVMVWSPRVEGGDAHAGFVETSLMLAVAPADVLVGRAEPGATEPIAQLMPRLRTDGIGAVSPNGVLGDPTSASADDGRALFARLATDLATAVAEWWDARTHPAPFPR